MAVPRARTSLPGRSHLRRPSGGPLRLACGLGPAGSAGGRALARRGSHRGPDRRRLLGQPAARGGLRAGDLARLPAAGAGDPAADVRPAAAPRPAGARAARAGRRASRDPPRRLARAGRARGVGNHAGDPHVLLRARGRRPRPPGGQAPRPRGLAQVPQRGGVRGGAGQGPEPGGRRRGGLSRPAATAARARVGARDGRAPRRPAPARRLHARAQARGHPARGARGDGGVARVDRAADRLRRRAALHRAGRPRDRGGPARPGRRTTGPSAGSWTPWRA